MKPKSSVGFISVRTEETGLIPNNDIRLRRLMMKPLKLNQQDLGNPQKCTWRIRTAFCSDSSQSTSPGYMFSMQLLIYRGTWSGS